MSRGEFRDKELARRAASKGGKNLPAEKRAFSRDHDLARRAGQMGGKKSAENRAKKKP